MSSKVEIFLWCWAGLKISKNSRKNLILHQNGGREIIIPEVISSPSNSTVKYVKSLLIKKYREEYGQFIIEGEKIVLEALASDSKLEMLVFSETYAHPLV